ncbi:MAG: hypothetical protein ACREL1_00515 [bacterium]
MIEYRITPQEEKPPTPADLLSGLQSRGFIVELNLNGPPDNWGALRFYLDGPADVECFLIRDEETKVLTASIPAESSARARELLTHLSDLLLEAVGGSLEDPEKGLTWTLPGFRAVHPELKAVPRRSFKAAWPVFAWTLAAISVAAYFNLPDNLHVLSQAVLALTLVSAIGLTLTSFEK